MITSTALGFGGEPVSIEAAGQQLPRLNWGAPGRWADLGGVAGVVQYYLQRASRNRRTASAGSFTEPLGSNPRSHPALGGRHEGVKTVAVVARRRRYTLGPLRPSRSLALGPDLKGHALLP
jgi:hypothetical protein